MNNPAQLEVFILLWMFFYYSSKLQVDIEEGEER